MSHMSYRYKYNCTNDIEHSEEERSYSFSPIRRRHNVHDGGQQEELTLDLPNKMPYLIGDKSLPIKAAGNSSVC